MADTIKGFNIGGSIKLIDWDGGVTNKPSIPSTVAELTDAADYATRADVSGHTTAVISALKNEGLYDAKGDAENAYARASAYTDTQIAGLNLSTTYDAKGDAENAYARASAYTDTQIAGLNLSTTYDAKGDAENAYARASAYTDTQIAGLNLTTTYAAKSTVDTLVGTDTGKSMRTISAEEVAKIVASADSKYDTLKEIADWILNDTTGAAKMANDIADLVAFSGEVYEKDEVVAGVMVDLDGRIDALEAISGQSHTHSNKAVLDTITNDKMSAWDNKQTALSDTDGGYGQRIKAVEDILANAINFEAQTY